AEKADTHRFTVYGFKRLLSQLLRALLYLTSAGIINRDLKPSNLAVDINGKLAVLDFGLARTIGRNDMTGAVGTSAYRAIEAILFSNKIASLDCNEKTDMWAIGAILCEMLTGNVLFAHPRPLLSAIDICGSIPEQVLAK
ncbi:hypothetical protein PFISCL1PPCAC_9204, partial [Pristionchus fissidentatus]